MTRSPMPRPAKTPAVTPGKAPVRPKVSKAPGEIRIIGGLWKRTRLAVPDRPGLRPTPDRVRETLFNWLGQDLGGWRCFDAFAGTGALGFEAASRGAREVWLMEQDSTLVQHLQASSIRLKASQVRVQRGDGVAQLVQQRGAGLDLVLLDPPFASDLFEPALRAGAQALQAEGFLYLEAPRAWTAEELLPLGLQPYRYLKAGAVHAHLLKRGSPAV
ncbi:16S rRNA (guanine(966)-N(2))-methyltransferase RsmD [Curvibacter gracilis]|uniref:16S rRNA (guanine(966)-N(2))-methyltransferase RsmD n=1 Tax=Curvibacter gracilis TaxID=230310 RepID=UPI0004B420F2|nr:16S rRNA (guanine(966)-N(2))-methyltransferase RsmD [Curvibacter gracilis]